MKKINNFLKGNRLFVIIIFTLVLSVFVGSRFLYLKKLNNKDLSGTIFTNEIVVSSLDFGKIEKIFVNKNDKVKENDLLLQLDSNLMDNKLKQLLASIDYEKAKENILRLKEDKGLEEYLNCKKGNGNEVNKKLNILEYIQSLRNLQQKKITKLESELSYFNEKKKNLFIYSPCNGTIQNLFVNTNQNIKLNEKLFSMSQTDNIWLSVKIPITKYKIGDDFNIFIENYPDIKFQGKIFDISLINNDISSKYIDAKISVNQIKVLPTEATLPLTNGMRALIKHERRK